MNARLRRVVKSCILMTYGSRQRRRKSQTPQSRARVTAAIRATAQCRRALGARLLHLSATGISLLAASTAVERPGPSGRIEVGVHREVATQFDPAGAVV